MVDYLFQLTQILTSNGRSIERNQQIVASFSKLLNRYCRWTSYNAVTVEVDDCSKNWVRNAFSTFIFSSFVRMCKLHAGTEHTEIMKFWLQNCTNLTGEDGMSYTYRPSIVFGWAVNIAGSIVKRVSSTSRVIRFSTCPVTADWLTVGEGVAVEQCANGEDDSTVERFICWDFVRKLLLLRVLLYADNKENDKDWMKFVQLNVEFIRCTLIDFCINDDVFRHLHHCCCKSCRYCFVEGSKTFQAQDYFAFGKIWKIL